jgi:hypothetical protein
MTSDSHEYPIQITVAPHANPFMAEIPDMFSPRLKFHKTQIGPFTDTDFDNAGMQGLTTDLCRGGGLVDIG